MENDLAHLAGGPAGPQRGGTDIAVSRSTRRQEQLLRAAVTVPTPVWPNLPGSGAFVPLVFLVAAIAAGFFAWSGSGLPESMAAWGLAGLRVVYPMGWQDRLAYAEFSPFYVWSIATALRLPFGSIFWQLTLPGFAYFMLSLLLLYRIARRWYSPGTGLLACFLFGVNHMALEGLRFGGPGTCSLFAVLLLVWCYLRHERTEEKFSLWLPACAGCVALMFLTAGWFTGWVMFLALLMQLYVELHRRRALSESLREAFRSSTFWAGCAVAFAGFAVASPWIRSFDYLGISVPATGDEPAVGMGILVAAMPATFVLAAFGFWHSARQCLRGGPETASSALLALWGLVGCLAITFSAPELALPFTLVPFTLLAARTFIALLNRKLSDRQVLSLMVASAWVFILAQSPASADLLNGVRGDVPLSAEQKLRIHYCLDLLFVSAVVAAGSYLLSMRHDRYRRRLVGGFVFLILMGACVPSIANLLPREDSSRTFRRTYESLQAYQDKSRIALVGAPESLSLRFVIRATFPRSEIVTVESLSEIEQALDGNPSQWLVLVTSPSSQLPTSTPIRQGESQVVLTKGLSDTLVAAYVETPSPKP